MKTTRLIIFRSEGISGLCAVPEALVRADETIDRASYVLSGWASKNCGLNPNGIGSHLFPNEGERIEGAEAERYRDLALRS